MSTALIPNPDAADGASVAGAMSGSGNPETVVSAPVGSTYWDYDGNQLYVKDTGTGNTGWFLFSGGGGGGGSGLSGNGTPEGNQVADPGTTYWDASGNVLWIKDTGSGNTGWREILA